MATIIVRTNPDPAKDGRWVCSQCRKYHADFGVAKRCAEKDYKRRTGRTTKERAA